MYNILNFSCAFLNAVKPRFEFETKYLGFKFQHHLGDTKLFRRVLSKYKKIYIRRNFGKNKWLPMCFFHVTNSYFSEFPDNDILNWKIWHFCTNTLLKLPRIFLSFNEIGKQSPISNIIKSSAHQQIFSKLNKKNPWFQNKSICGSTFPKYFHRVCKITNR